MSVTVSTHAPLVPQSMDQAVRMAELMSKGKLMPVHLQNAPGDCLMVVEAAMRWGMSPFAVAQCTSVIQGKLMFEGKLVAAAVQTSGILAGRLSYEYSGSGESRAVRVLGTMRGEEKPRDVVVALKEARTNNKVWAMQPDQQLAYHGARVWARRHTPEVMLGVYSPDEFEAPEAEAHTGPTITAHAEPVVDAQPEPPRRSVRQFLDELEMELRSTADGGAVVRIQAREDVQKALNGGLTNGALTRLQDMLDAALARHCEPGMDADEPVEEVVA